MSYVWELIKENKGKKFFSWEIGTSIKVLFFGDFLQLVLLMVNLFICMYSQYNYG